MLSASQASSSHAVLSSSTEDCVQNGRRLLVGRRLWRRQNGRKGIMPWGGQGGHAAEQNGHRRRCLTCSMLPTKTSVTHTITFNGTAAAAAVRLQPNGWRRDRGRDPNCCVCHRSVAAPAHAADLNARRGGRGGQQGGRVAFGMGRGDDLGGGDDGGIGVRHDDYLSAGSRHLRHG